MKLKIFTDKEKRINKFINVCILICGASLLLLFVFAIMNSFIKIPESLSFLFIIICIIATLSFTIGFVASIIRIGKVQKINFNLNEINSLSLNMDEKDFINNNPNYLENQGNWLLHNQNKYEINARSSKKIMKLIPEKIITCKKQDINGLEDEPIKILFDVCQSLGIYY